MKFSSGAAVRGSTQDRTQRCFRKGKKGSPGEGEGGGFQALDNTCTFKEEEGRRNKEKKRNTRRALTLERFLDALK